MKNLEQIRAANALAFTHAGVNTKGKDAGNVLKKLPALIMTNGLLAAGAFAYAQKQDSGWRNAFDYMARHLAHKEVAIVAPEIKDLDQLMAFLSGKADSQVLKLATEEALAWLSYARRFEAAEDQGDDDHDSNG